MNVKWTKGAAKDTVATPSAATTASVPRALDWGQMAKHVTVRWTSGWSCCAQTQTECSMLPPQRGLPFAVSRHVFMSKVKMTVPGAEGAHYAFKQT